MTWFKNLKIEKKLILSFLLILAIAIAVSVYGLTVMNTIVDDFTSTIGLAKGYMNNALNSEDDRHEYLLSVLAALETGASENNIRATQARNLTIAAIAAMAAAVIALSIYVPKLISKPLTFLVTVLSELARTGNFYIDKVSERQIARYRRRKDEIGQILNSFAGLIEMMMRKLRSLEKISNGDLASKIVHRSEKDSYAGAMQAVLDNLNDMFEEIQETTVQVSAGAKQLAEGAQTLAQGSSEQANSVVQLSAAVKEISRKTKYNAKIAGEASVLSGSIINTAETGSRQMDEMILAVKDINDASQSIGKIIKTIDDIAFQTNILALNAAVEAARAGQHGKGFAVVAEEVRSLAAKSAEAAKETGGIISNSVEKAEMGARIAGQTAESLSEIVSGINESNRIVGEIALLSQEQSEVVEQLNTGIGDVSQVVQQNSATAQESAAFSAQMSNQSRTLEGLVAQFKLKGSTEEPLGLPAAGQDRQGQQAQEIFFAASED